jgi:hypothetical protein
MTDHKNTDPDHSKIVRYPTALVSPTAGHLTAKDLVRLAGIREAADRQPQEVTINVVSDRPQTRGDEILRKFLPYFVISTMSLILLGGVAAILGMVIPMVMALVLAVISSFVSIILSLVVTVIAGVVLALGISYLQTINMQYDEDDHYDD